MNPLAISLIIAAFAWQQPPIPASQVEEMGTDAPLGMATCAVPAESLDQCPRDQKRILLNADWRQWEPEFLCSVIVHEAGHLAGHEHSTNKRNIMYPVLLNIYPSCGYEFDLLRGEPQNVRPDPAARR